MPNSHWSGRVCAARERCAQRALVERHRDVGAQVLLHLDRALGRQRVAGAVDVALEHHALFAQLAQPREREHLVAAAVGQERARPAAEAVQAAELLHDVVPRPQHQVVGVREQDLRAELVEVAARHRFHGACRAHGHEGRRLDLAVGSHEPAGAGPTARGGHGEAEHEGRQYRCGAPPPAASHHIK
jgi:hypothetical protein